MLFDCYAWEICFAIRELGRLKQCWWQWLTIEFIRITSKFSSFTQFLRWIFVTLVGLFLQWKFALCGLSVSNVLLPDQNYLHLISSAKYSPCNSLAPHMVVYAQLELKKATIAQNRDGGYVVRYLGVFMWFLIKYNIRTRLENMILSQLKIGELQVIWWTTKF